MGISWNRATPFTGGFPIQHHPRLDKGSGSNCRCSAMAKPAMPRSCPGAWGSWLLQLVDGSPMRLWSPNKNGQLVMGMK